jgi:Flp pilus assembly protein TadG
MKSIQGLRDRERGASLIEFAMIMPLIIILLLGIVEFGWIFGQFNDVRHGAREGARIAAVNQGDNSFLLNYVCDSMDLNSPATVQFTDPGSGKIGSTGAVAVVATPGSLSGLGLIEVFLPNTLTSDIDFRLEQDSGAWSSFGPTACP